MLEALGPDEASIADGLRPLHHLAVVVEPPRTRMLLARTIGLPPLAGRWGPCLDVHAHDPRPISASPADQVPEEARRACRVTPSRWLLNAPVSTTKCPTRVSPTWISPTRAW